MKRVYVFLLFVLVALGLAFANRQQDWSKVEIETIKVAESVYMLKGEGGNIGVSIGEDGVVMVDDQFAPLSDKIKAAIDDLGGAHPKYILNTHHHGDHTGGNPVFGKEGDIISHTNVRKRLSSKPEDFWPVITFDSSLSIYMNGEEIRALHYPAAHTDGDAAIYFKKSNVVHTGDLFFSGMLPYVDLNSGGNVQGYIEVIEKLLQQLPPDVKLIPGHGPLSTKDDLKRFHDMLIETTAIVRDQMQNGMSLVQIKENGLPDKYKSWETSFVNRDRWVETIYNSYSPN